MQMPWLLSGALLGPVPSVPKLTCPREHGETFLLINLNKDNRLRKCRLSITFVGGLNHAWCDFRVVFQIAAQNNRNITIRLRKLIFAESWMIELNFSLFYLIIKENRVPNYLVKKKVLLLQSFLKWWWCVLEVG